MARKSDTVQLQGGTPYAKVAERLRLFRNDFPRSKTETAYEFDADKTIVFIVWVWKDKTDLLDLMKAGVTDKETLRSTADANGTAKSKGEIGTKDKDFEKLESVALGRALAMLGYLASGEIASFEEMEEFEKFRKAQTAEAVEQAIDNMSKAKNLDELKKAFVVTGMIENPDIVAAKDKLKSALSDGKPASAPKSKTTVKTPPVKPTETIKDDKVTEPASPIDKTPKGQPSLLDNSESSNEDS